MTETANPTAPLDLSFEEGAGPSPTRPRFAERFQRARYTAAQATRVAWYASHYAVMRRAAARHAKAAGRIQPGDAAQFRADAVRASFVKLFRDDLANIEAGLYPAPRDMDVRRLGRALSNSARFMREAPNVFKRAARRKGGVEVREGADKARYPTYYLQNFHFQSDGWLSRDSARVYDTQVEVLFTGAADAMRRAALAEIATHLKGRDQRQIALADVAAGTGRFLAQVLDAFPRLNATAVDLSPDYVAEAGERLRPWPQARAVEGNAETLPFEDASLDVVVSIYLFHELPPRVRPIVAAEFARVVKPGGLVVFADSVQKGDDPALDPLLEGFPKTFHEPYYAHYASDDLKAHFTAAGLEPAGERLAFLTKVLSFTKAS